MPHHLEGRLQTAQGALFNTLVAGPRDQQVRASHLTLLNALSNVGKMLPRPVAYKIVDVCGFGAGSAVLTLAGVMIWPLIVRLLPAVIGAPLLP